MVASQGRVGITGEPVLRHGTRLALQASQPWSGELAGRSPVLWQFSDQAILWRLGLYDLRKLDTSNKQKNPERIHSVVSLKFSERNLLPLCERKMPACFPLGSLMWMKTKGSLQQSPL